jgi:hypothetical protein
MSSNIFHQLMSWLLVLVHSNVKSKLFSLTMIIKIDLCELGIRSISGCHYNNFGHGALDVSIEWNEVEQYLFKILGNFMSQLHIGMNQCFTLEILCFPCLGANKMNLLHVTNYIISLLPFSKKTFISTWHIIDIWTCVV